jgi:hypothetical protein
MARQLSRIDANTQCGLIARKGGNVGSSKLKIYRSSAAESRAESNNKISESGKLAQVNYAGKQKRFLIALGLLTAVKERNTETPRPQREEAAGGSN